jgi:hypothetical protein
MNTNKYQKVFQNIDINESNVKKKRKNATKNVEKDLVINIKSDLGTISNTKQIQDILSIIGKHMNEDLMKLYRIYTENPQDFENQKQNYIQKYNQSIQQIQNIMKNLNQTNLQSITIPDILQIQFKGIEYRNFVNNFKSLYQINPYWKSILISNPNYGSSLSSLQFYFNMMMAYKPILVRQGEEDWINKISYNEFRELYNKWYIPIPNEWKTTILSFAGDDGMKQKMVNSNLFKYGIEIPLNLRNPEITNKGRQKYSSLACDNPVSGYIDEWNGAKKDGEVSFYSESGLRSILTELRKMRKKGGKINKNDIKWGSLLKYPQAFIDLLGELDLYNTNQSDSSIIEVTDGVLLKSSIIFLIRNAIRCQGCL